MGLRPRTGKRIYLLRLKVTRRPRARSAELRCKGQALPVPAPALHADRKGAITLFKVIKAAKVGKRKTQLPRPPAVQLRITAPGYIGKVVKYKLKRRKQPVGRGLCLPPGTTKPVKC